MNAVVLRLGLVSLFADISSEMLYPITPIFLSTVLGASYANIGMIEGLAEAVASILKIASGYYSDKWGHRKSFVVVGYFLSAIAKPLTGFAGAWPQVLTARLVDRFGKGVRNAPRDALLADAVEEKDLGLAFGFHRGMDSVGAVVGPLIAILFLEGNMRNAFLVAFLPGLVAAALVLSIREPRPHLKLVAQPNANNSIGTPFYLYLLIWFIFSFTNSSDVFIILKATQSGLSHTTVILLYCAYNFVYSIGSPFLGKLSDRLGQTSILGLGFFVFAITYLGFAYANHLWQFILLFLVYGGYIAATDGVGKALAARLLPSTSRALGLGWMGALTGVANFIASFSAGYLWDHYGAHWPFLFGAAGAFAALIALLLCYPKLTYANGRSIIKVDP